ncbi:hypothetical protein BCR34DRAFT_592950 [Clohesyomyces aquaticus]|uniref:Uncharacterized protein n=1 Tax=Clohesyomyces aquaticus TaxID=1231657 RepID=A0A1Y1YMS6_9PLEO|nr:hypothetical protein BCR34DRAFT_592950 [Clohesyomyces aquaticus]
MAGWLHKLQAAAHGGAHVHLHLVLAPTDCAAVWYELRGHGGRPRALDGWKKTMVTRPGGHLEHDLAIVVCQEGGGPNGTGRSHQPPPGGDASRTFTVAAFNLTSSDWGLE